MIQLRVMLYRPLPGPEPTRESFGALDPRVAARCHPFLPPESVNVADLQAYYASGVAGGPKYFTEHWLQAEAGISLNEPDRVLAAGQGFQEVIDQALNPEWVGRSAMALCYIPAMAGRAEDAPLNPGTVDTTLSNLARLLSSETVTLHKGDKAEGVVLALAAILAKDDLSYFLQAASMRQGFHPSRKHNADAHAPDRLPIQIKLKSGHGGYDPQVLPVRLWSILVQSGLADVQLGRQPKSPEPERAQDELARLIARNVLHDEEHPALVLATASLKTMIDEHRSGFPMPPRLTDIEYIPKTQQPMPPKRPAEQ